MFEPNAIINALGLTLLHFLWQGLVIGLVYGCGKYLLRTASTDGRYAWALSALLVLLITPLINFLYFYSTPVSGAVEGTTRLATMAVDVTRGTDPLALSVSLLPWVVALWALGVSLMSIRISLGWWYLHRLRRTADFAIPPRFYTTLTRLAQQLRIRQRVGLATSEQVNGPMLVGLLRPLILMPAALLSGLTPRQLEMVLAHELAHIKRFDHLVNLLQVVAETLLFHQPVVRWVSRDLRIEREIASDELAADLVGDRVSYAETLLALEKQRGNQLSFALGMADHQVAARVRRLLQPPRRQKGSIGIGMVALITALGAAATGLYQGQAEVSQAPEPETPAVLESRIDTLSITETLDDTIEEAEPARVDVDRQLPETPVVDDAVDMDDATDEDLVAMAETPETETAEASETAAETETGTGTGTETGGGSEAIVEGETEAVEEPVSESTAPPMETETLPEVPSEGDRTDEPTTEAIAPEENLQLASLDEQLPEAGLPTPSQPSRSTTPQQAELAGGRPIHRPAPDYPVAARRHGHGGSVEVRFTVDRNGRVRDAEVISASPSGYGFEQEALDAVRDWRFEPFTRGGEAVTHEVETGFDFGEPTECSRYTGSRIPRC